jgi:hypothetical protein
MGSGRRRAWVRRPVAKRAAQDGCGGRGSTVERLQRHGSVNGETVRGEFERFWGEVYSAKNISNGSSFGPLLKFK